MQFESNLRELAEEIKKNGKRKVAIQLPEGLKKNAFFIIDYLKKEGIDAVYAANPCYGACDLAVKEVRISGAEALVHIGHSKFYVDIKTEFPIIYFPWKVKVNFDSVDFSFIQEKKIGIITTVQHTDILEDVRKRLEEKGKEAIIGGQILGCNDVAAKRIEDKVDAFLFIGSGSFHPIALKGKKIYVLDVEKKEIGLFDSGFMEKRRWASIYNAKDAKVFGVLVSTKPGQKELIGNAEKIKEKIENSGKKAFIIMMDEITDRNLMGIDADAFVNTACPRITDDSFSRPLINANDLEEVLKD